MDNNYVICNGELYHYGKKGMKWGVRRYQNVDGSLTEAGQKRYARDLRENAGKKKGDRVGQADPNRWVREDLERSKKLTDASSQMVRDLKNTTNTFGKSPTKMKLDLSSMSDQQMRNEINRALLERQYNDMFAPQKAARGKEVALKTLEVAGSVLAIGASSLGIALAIKELRG